MILRKLRSAAFSMQKAEEPSKHNSNTIQESDLKSQFCSYANIIKNSVLPYTVHSKNILYSNFMMIDNETHIPATLQVKKEVPNMHKRMLPKLIQCECLIKEKIISKQFFKKLMMLTKTFRCYFI